MLSYAIFCFSKRSTWFRLHKIQRRIIYLSIFFAFSSYQDEELFTNKRWIHYDAPICSREFKNRNFLVEFIAIFGAITEFVTFSFRIMFFSKSM